MPELPEAETIARDLDPRLKGARITGASVRHPDVLETSPTIFENDIQDRRIAGAARRGKNVVLAFDDGSRLVVNLGMTGRLVLSDSPRATELRHIAVRLELEDGRSVLYDDVRRFGRLALLESGAWARRDEELGLEPLGATFTAGVLWQLTRRTRTPIRNFLLDQSKVAGVGNIYALEALFRARIRPTRRGHRVTRAEAAALHEALRAVLSEAIVHRGTTFSDYRDATGEAGAFQPLLKVYGREGASCIDCGATIKRRVLTNRSAFYCPVCQP